MTAITRNPFLRFTCRHILHAKYPRNMTGKNINLRISHKAPCFYGDLKGLSWQAWKHSVLDCFGNPETASLMTKPSGFLLIKKSRREWMGVEPTAARNATRHRF